MGDVRRVLSTALMVTIMMPLEPFAQVVPTPQSPSTEEPKGWLDKWREGTVSLGKIEEAEILTNGVKNKKKIFVPVGTGIVVHEDDGKVLWLVTAKHVFDDPEQAWHPQSL